MVPALKSRTRRLFILLGFFMTSTGVISSIAEAHANRSGTIFGTGRADL